MKKIFALFLILLAGVIYYISDNVKYNEHKDEIRSKLEAALDMSIEIDGDVTMSFFPSPSLNLHKVVGKIGNKEALSVSTIELHTSFWALISNNWNIKQVVLNDGNMKQFMLKNHFAKHSEFTEKGLAASLPGIYMRKINLEDDMWGYNLKNLDLDLKSKGIFGNSGISAKSGFTVNDVKHNITFDLSGFDSKTGNGNFEFNISNDKGVVKAKGSGENLLSEPKVIGTISGNLANGKASKVAEEIGVKGEFEFSKTGGVIKNIVATSANINNISGSITVDMSYAMDIHSILVVESLNLDGIMQNISGLEDSSDTNLTEALQYTIDNFDFEINKDISASLMLNINNIKYHNDNIQKIVLNADCTSGHINISQLQFEFPGNGKLSMTGGISHNNIRPKLDGNITFMVQNLKDFTKWVHASETTAVTANTLGFSAEVLLIPHNMSLRNIDASIDKMSFKGMIGAHHSAQSEMSINTTIDLDQIDSETLGVNAYVNEFLLKLFESDADKTGETLGKNMNDFQWLRTFPVAWNCDVDISQFKFQNYNFKRLFLSLSVERNNLTISKVIADSELAKFNASVNFALEDLRPKLKVNLNADYIDTSVKGLLLPALSDLKKAAESVKAAAFNTDFNFFAASNYDANILGHVNILKSGEMELANVELDAGSESGTLYVRKLTGDIFEGKFNFYSTVSVAGTIPVISSVFSLENINPHDLLYKAYGMDKIHGYMSITGNFNTTGLTIASLYDKMEGKILISAKDIDWKGFDLNEIVKNTEVMAEISEKLKRISYYMQNGESFFDAIKGEINIANGVADFVNFKMEHPRMPGVLVAKYDIYNGIINSIAKFSFIPVGEYQPLSIQFQNNGKLDSTKVNLVYDQLSQYISAKNALKTEGSKNIRDILLQGNAQPSQ